jgi:hypothetical protein
VQGEIAVASGGRTIGPKWLLKVEFRGDNILQQTRVRYEWERGGGNFDLSLRQQIEESGYTVISYAMSSARQLFSELPEFKKPRPATQPKTRGITSQNRELYSINMLTPGGPFAVTALNSSGWTNFALPTKIRLLTDISAVQLSPRLLSRRRLQ